MKNIVGQTPRGEDFYKREKIIKRIYRRLDGGDHLFLAAPRRVGKTSIMRYLEDFPEAGFEFIYVNVEAFDRSNAFYAEIIKAVVKSDALNKLVKTATISKQFVEQALNKISKIQLLGTGITLNKDDASNTYDDLQELIAKLEKGNETVVLMLDEFPQTVENILKKSGKEVADIFLRQIRTLRQLTNNKVRFIYTGSIGLQTIVEQITTGAVINDINTLAVPPLDYREAKELVYRLLNYQKVPFHEQAVDYLLERIGWLIPFHIQLLVQEIIDVYEDTEEQITNQSVEEAFKRTLHVRNDKYFSSMLERLEMRHTDQQQKDFVFQLLDNIAKNSGLSDTATKEIATNFKQDFTWRSTLDLLVYEGYINNDNRDQLYRFNSPLLLLWWQKKRIG